MKNFSAFASSLLASAFLSFPAVMSLGESVLALPAEKVSAKLNTVAVYVVMEKRQGNKNKADLLFTKLQDGSLYIPLFLQRRSAEERLKTLDGSDSKNNNLIVTMTLSQALSAVQDVRALEVNKEVKILAPIAGSQADRDKAEEILKASGASEDQVKSGLSVPVFYTDPMIEVPTSNGKKQAFFFESAQLKDFAVKSFGEDVFDKKKLVMKAGDLNAVLSVIKNEATDIYIFYPNSAYLESNPNIINNSL